MVGGEFGVCCYGGVCVWVSGGLSGEFGTGNKIVMRWGVEVQVM